MKICFITPGSVFLLDERVFLNLGILKVAAACIARGHQVEHLDLDGVKNYEETTGIHLGQSDSECFALTATTPQMPAATNIVRSIRAARPEAKIILGGPHPTLTLAAAKLEKARGVEGRAHRALKQLEDLVDVVVAGDGEDAIESALRVKKGVIDADDPKGPLFLTKKRLEELPFPARHLIDLDSYRYSIDGVRATSLICQLGCPFNCTFCGGRASPMLRRARMRSTDAVLAEIEHLYTAYGFMGFMLYDDELNVNPKMVELMRGISALQKRLGVPGQFRLRGFVKSELVTREQMEVMYEAGFRWILCGFEAGHPRILENIQKKATVEDNDRCVALAHAAGLKVKALMSVGHAGESHETVDAVRTWLLRNRPEDFDCTVITPYPGSPYFDQATQLDRAPAWTYVSPLTGDRLHAHELDYTTTADYYKSKPEDGYRSYVFTDYMTADELISERDKLENSVRAELNIPFNPGSPGIQFEASMGQTKLPATILRAHGS